MAEKEYIERGALLAEDFTDSFVDIYDVAIFEHIIETAPAADVVEVVRCKDCKHACFLYSCDRYMCKKGCGATKSENDFCSYGERKKQK